MFNKRVYLDCAAGLSGNPSSPHEEGRRAKQMLEDARTAIARLIEVQTDDVIFTSGATEGNALAILGTVKKGDHVLYLPSAHASIVENVKLLVGRGVDIEPLPIKDCRVDTGALAKILRPETKLVSMDAVCGETGVIWNTREVRKIIGSKILLHVDASQSPLTEKFSRAHFDADILTFDASKVGTARGIGAIVAHRTIPITPLYEGGGQERGVRSGSEAPVLAKIFADDLQNAFNNREKFRAYAKIEREKLIKFITSEIKDVFINESREQTPNILNISLIGRDTDYLVALLDEVGFAVSTKSACETDSQEGSRAVFALFGDKSRAMSTLRISWNSDASPRDLKRFAKAIKQSVLFVDSSGQR